MTHYMKLQPEPFGLIAERRKTVELRLFDEKRRAIAVGDTVVFSNTAEPTATLRCRVVGLHRFGSFAELYRAFSPECLGYLPEECASASPLDMEAYYSKEEQALYGVVGIEIALV